MTSNPQAMRTYSRSNTAFFICLAFVFRLLFVNVGLFANSSQTLSVISTHFSTVQKKRRQLQTVPQYDAKQNATAEIFEEDSDIEEDLLKSNYPTVLFTISSFFKKISHTLNPNTLFDRIKCELYPKQYLRLSILRI